MFIPGPELLLITQNVAHIADLCTSLYLVVGRKWFGTLYLGRVLGDRPHGQKIGFVVGRRLPNIQNRER